MRYYIADCHFFHENINHRMDKRGFSDALEMNEYMIKRWNDKVRRNDEVVILGDLSLARADPTNEILGRLNGRLYLLVGNHDKWVRQSSANLGRFQWVKDYAEMADDGRKVVLSHYYIPTYNGQYRRNQDGTPKTWMLFGHVHNTLDMKYIDDYQDAVRKQVRKAEGYEGLQNVPSQAINCFCVYSDYTPLTLDEWIEIEKTRRERFPYQV